MATSIAASDNHPRQHEDDAATSAPDRHSSAPRGLDLDMDTLTNEELFVIQDLATRMLWERGITIPNPPIIPRPPDAFKNAKYEQIACAGLKPRYNGSPNELIPTLNLIRIHQQNETWCPAIFITDASGVTINLMQEFSKVDGTTVLSRAKSVWDHPQIQMTRHIQGTDAYNARLLGVFLTNSLTNDFLQSSMAELTPSTAWMVHCCSSPCVTTFIATMLLSLSL